LKEKFSNQEIFWSLGVKRKKFPNLFFPKIFSQNLENCSRGVRSKNKRSEGFTD